MSQLEINCDMGESYGAFQVGKDELLIPYVDACNIACGFHGGDPLTLEKTIKMACDQDKTIGAHPSYPDLMGFGRRAMTLSNEELKASVKYQIAAVKGLVESHKGTLSYIKPHGALYNKMAYDAIEASTFIDAMLEIDPTLRLMGLAGSHLNEICQNKGVEFIPEAFADRRYLKDGTLVNRNSPNALISDPNEAAEQVLSIVKHGHVICASNEIITLKASSICVHGDHKNSLDILKAIDKILKQNGIRQRI